MTIMNTNTSANNSDIYKKQTGINTNSSDSECLERFLKENKLLKEKVNQLEQENIKLKKSLFDLAIQRNNNSANSNNNGGGSGGVGSANNLLNQNFQLSSNLSLDQLFLNNPNFNNIQQNLNNNNNNNNQFNINNTNNNIGTGNSNNIDFNKLQFINSSNNCNINKSLQANSSTGGGNNYQGKKFKLKQNIKAHSGAIYSVNYSLSQNLIGTGGLDKTLKLWKFNEDLSQYDLQLNLKDQNSSISHLEFSNLTNHLSSTSLDYLVNIYDTQEGKLVNSTKLNNLGLPLFNTFHKSDPNRLFVSTSRGEIIEKDFRSSNIIPRFKRTGLKLNSLLTKLGFNNNLFFGNELGNLEVFDDRMNKSIELSLNNNDNSMGGYQSTSLNGFNDNPLLTHLTAPINAPDSTLLAINFTNHTNSIYDLNYSGQLNDSIELNPQNWQLNNIKNYSGYENSYTNIRCSMILDDSDCWFVTGSSDGIIYLNCNRIDKLSSPNLNSQNLNEILVQDQLNQNLTRIYDVQFKPSNLGGLEFSSVGCDGHLRIWSL